MPRPVNYGIAMQTAPPTTTWGRLTPAVPLTSVQMLVTDGTNLLLIHRSDKVRSVKNTWSFPSGLHDVGETIFDTARRELMEEFNLKATQAVTIGAYENIVLDETPAWHWVLFLMAVKVESFDTLVNNEPDKHDKIEMFDMNRLDVSQGVIDLVNEYNFHKSFDSFARSRAWDIRTALQSIRTVNTSGQVLVKILSPIHSYPAI